MLLYLQAICELAFLILQVYIMINKKIIANQKFNVSSSQKFKKQNHKNLF